MLDIKVNFQREGLGYTPPAKSTPQRSMNIPHVSKPSSANYVHVSQKATPPKLTQYVISYAPRKSHKTRNFVKRSMPKIVYNYCEK